MTKEGEYIDDDDIFFVSPRDYDEQTDALRFDLDDLVDRYTSEFDLNTITIIGALQEKIEELADSGNIEFTMDEDFFN
jgi:hypothetical protein